MENPHWAIAFILLLMTAVQAAGQMGGDSSDTPRLQFELARVRDELRELRNVVSSLESACRQRP